jgi:hypothetical protein
LTLHYGIISCSLLIGNLASQLLEYREIGLKIKQIFCS